VNKKKANPRPGFHNIKRKPMQFNRFWKIVGILILIGMGIGGGILFQIFATLPDVSLIETYTPFETTEIYSADKKILASLHKEEDRSVVSLSEISPHLIKAIIVSEDDQFFYHHGVSLRGMVRALLKNITHLRLAQGGSTITQQLARNLFLVPKKTFIRKFSEILLALRIERRYSKETILELYLNQVYWGYNSHGAEAAAQIYFGKSAKDLSLAEASLLAAIVRGPELYSPYRRFELAKERQENLLKRMANLRVITSEQAEEAIKKELEFSTSRKHRYRHKAPYFINYIVDQLVERYGEEAVYGGGLTVYTSIDSKLQEVAEKIVTEVVSKEGERYNFSQAALVCVDPKTGHVKAMVGGVDFVESQFNRAVQAKRQAGSSFKPFVYAAALEEGVSPGYIIEDAEIKYYTPEGEWEPKNYDEKFRGNVSLRYALAKSLNVPSIKLLEKIGVTPAINLAHRLGIESHLEPNLALTLGASEVNLLEMTSAFGVFANNGVRVPYVSIVKVKSRDDIEIYRHEVEEQNVLDKNIAATIVDMMKGVIGFGTGTAAKLDRPAAAKTGTTEEFRDSWFIGFTPQLVTGVWLGNDDNASMTGRGFTEVGIGPRIWKRFMQFALKEMPIEEFPKPKGLVKVKVCLNSKLLARAECPKDRVEILDYWEGKEPKDLCDEHRPTLVPPTWMDELLGIPKGE
jgi:penicillin-binding protein 1A